uniref:Uncharacterized protein n=1 Tax=Anguilla anguilla TaxID=7936 RepID=A0A0E9W9S9_ANGAN
MLLSQMDESNESKTTNSCESFSLFLQNGIQFRLKSLAVGRGHPLQAD